MASLDDIATGDTSDDTTDAASDDGDTAPATSEPVDAEPVDMEQAMLDFAACMRSHGVDMPDPDFDENGRLADSESVTVTAPEGEDGPTAVLSGPFGVLEMNDPATIEAFEACSEGTMFGGTRVAVDSARDEAGE